MCSSARGCGRDGGSERSESKGGLGEGAKAHPCGEVRVTQGPAWTRGPSCSAGTKGLGTNWEGAGLGRGCESPGQQERWAGGHRDRGTSGTP